MIVLGIDPGYAILGYGVIDTDGKTMKAVDYGVIETNNTMTFPERLERLYLGVCQLTEMYKPEHIAFEELFFAKNVKTALMVGAGRGVALLAAQKCCTQLFEYTPMQIKSAVAGYGHADKKQVQSMVKLLLKLSVMPKPDDAADALGAAICHITCMKPGMDEFRIK